ncbi:flagellar biosynthesis protein FlhB [Paenibacillus swuensis]|uniref:Flagellar biosynthetic protein FlhB n=1 Tax=Paenibacillus swuensis TaxID=1178515 RepID=A0A172TKP6_9BACL|nr:flagellar biosynthesis protein FlhB [Paenibacillus swuensis]ANE47552.1 flagellar biosynthesis protein FlhB [Paenibacillus swuensis]
MQPLRLKLNLQQFSGEKTEQATPKKREDSRKKGQVAKSMEIPGAFILLISFMSFSMFGEFYKERIYRLFSVTFHDYMNMQVTQANVGKIFGDLITQCLILIAPIMAITVIVAILGNYAQFGFLLTGDPLKMKFEKLNPLEGAKRIFSLRSLVEMLKSIAKVLIVGIVAYMTLWGERMNIIALSTVPLESIFTFSAGLVLSLGIKIGAILVVLAVLDYAYQKYDFEKNLRMSKQDIKDEYKKSEGDPLIKAKIREKQKRMAMQRMMQEVPKADVIITNPTHFAIALKYDAKTMESPLVLAKGKDYVALKIKEIAKQEGILTMENRPLARALYDQAEIGQGIPVALFQAVAEVLAYVYKMKRKV